MAEYIQLYTDAAATQSVYPYTETDAVINLNNLLSNKQSLHKTIALTLLSNSWSNLTQTITAAGVTSNNTIIVSPDPSSFKAYTKAGIYCSAQGNNSLSFICDTVPGSNITVNIIILD